jgi:hypothetical protein
MIWLDYRVPEGSTGELQMDDMPGDFWIRWNSVMRIHVFL